MSITVTYYAMYVANNFKSKSRIHWFLIGAWGKLYGSSCGLEGDQTESVWVAVTGHVMRNICNFTFASTYKSGAYQDNAYRESVYYIFSCENMVQIKIQNFSEPKRDS